MKNAVLNEIRDFAKAKLSELSPCAESNIGDSSVILRIKDANGNNLVVTIEEREGDNSLVFSALAEKVMEFMRNKKFDIDHLLTNGNSWRLIFLQSLTPIEREQIQDAVQELIDKGVLTEDLRLTEFGRKALYK